MANPSRNEYLASETHLGPGPVRDRGRCVVVFPNSYRVGMSSLSLHTIYSLVNRAGLICERAFAPDERPISDARSLESSTPLGGFEFILITSSFELDWLNIPAMLSAGGVPPRREDRDERCPIVIVGGPAITANPEPLAGVYDLAVIGEIEPISGEFLAALAEAENREEVFERLGALPGVYVPTKPEHAPELGADRVQVARLCAEDINEFTTASAILTPHTEFADRYLIEIGRGCGRSCKFCLARQIYHPHRARRPEGLLAAIDAALQHTERIGLVSAAVSDYPWGDELFAGLMARGAQVSVSSARAESVTEGLVACLAASGAETLTLAPEAGSEELREAIGKGMSDENLIRAIELGLAAGIPRYKLYFMVGLPGETEEDIAAIPELISRLREAAPAAMFSVSASPFVPKPHTPFARAEMLPEATLSRRLKAVSRELGRQGIGDVTIGSARWASAQALLSRGGRELGEALIEASLAGGGLGEFRAAMKP